jgi:branched-chain amino acid transport system ATP-binding protein
MGIREATGQGKSGAAIAPIRRWNRPPSFDARTGRALMSEPKLLCIDEPSTGLAPLMRNEVFERIAEINRLGITLLLVEQEVSTVFKMATRNYVLSSGKIIAEGTADKLLQDEVLRKTYLGL